MVRNLNGLPLLVSLLLAVLLTACGGGGGGAEESPPPLGGNPVTAAQDAEAVSRALNALTFGEIAGENAAPQTLIHPLTLPSAGREGCLIRWSSSAPEVVGDDGRVARPAPGEAPRSVVLTATASRGEASAQRQFVLTVLPLPDGDAEAVGEAAELLRFEDFRGENLGEAQIVSDLRLPAAGANRTAISWDTNDPAISAQGRVSRPGYLEGDRSVQLTARISRGEALQSRTFVLTVLHLPATDAEAVQVDAASLTFALIRGENPDPRALTSDLRLLAAGANGTSIAWQSDHPAVAPDGTVTRPAAGAGAADVRLTASIRRGAAREERAFDLRVLELSARDLYLYSGTGVGIHHVETPETAAGDLTFRYAIDLGAAERDVYFVFSNTAGVEASGDPAVTPLSLPDPRDALSRAEAESAALADWAREAGVGLAGTPAISLYNSDPWTYGEVESRVGALALEAPEPPRFDVVGASDVFHDAWDAPVSATCRRIVHADGKTLNLWVAENAWAGPGCTRARCVTPTMLDGLAERFLREGPDNDIFDWGTGIFGEEWGAHGSSRLIPDDGQITILLMDLQGDNSTFGGVLGYFFSRDNYRASASALSNERVMFAVDSVLFAKESGTSWEITDPWPQELLGTLAHEFQHMIHFYQKNVLRGGRSETWLNEMCSTVATDLVAARLGIRGPRGVSPEDGSGGFAGVRSGELARFSYFNYLPLSRWMEGSIGASGDDNVLNSYAVGYAFGAYLARNYGGAALFRDVVQNGYGDQRAVEEALALGGFAEDFASVLQKWGAAVLLSDRTGFEVPAGYRYNYGTFIEAGMEGMSLPLGSINLFHYGYNGTSGPRIFTALPQPGSAGNYPHSNLLFRLGTRLSGTLSQEITLRAGTRLSIVVK